MKNSNLLINIFKNTIYIYLLLPSFLFIMGWTKWYVALFSCVLICFAYYKAIQSETLEFDSELFKDNWIKLVIAFAVICLWVYLSGIGGYCYQNSDHEIRNAIYRCLVEYDWPVTSLNGYRGLIYYIGYWVPAALFGKVFGYNAGLYFLYLYTVIGIFIIYLLICVKRKKVSLWPLLLLLFFSGLDYVGGKLLGREEVHLRTTAHIEWWADYFQYSSNTTQLFWVFNQAIPAWVLMALFYVSHKKENLLFLLASILISSTFPFVGFIPFVTYWLFEHYNKGDFKKIFSYQNCIGVIVIGGICFTYLLGNVSASKVAEGAKKVDEATWVYKYIYFCIFEFVIYMIFLLKSNKRNPVYWIILIVLLVCPWIRVGSSYDFSMRVSIPALFLLLLMVIEYIDERIKNKKWFVLGVLSIVLCIGAITPTHEIARTIKNTIDQKSNDESVMAEEEDIEKMLKMDNFSGKTSTNFFFQHLAK